MFRKTDSLRMFYLLICSLIYLLTAIYDGDALAAQKKILVGISIWGSNSDYEKNIQGFKAGLKEAGFVEGDNIEYWIQNPHGDFDRQVNIIENYVDKDADIIYALTTPGTLAAKSVTQDVPIVFSIVTYPVETEVIQSLSSSRNNLVGTRNYISPARQFYYFEQIYPDTKTLAFIHRKGEPNSVIQFEEFKDYLKKRKIEIIDIAAIDLHDMRRQLEFHNEKIDSFYLACDTLIQAGGADVAIQVGKKYKKPVLSCVGDAIYKGALLGNVADLFEIGKLSGKKASLILKGVPPTRINTESPTKGYILVNQKAANDLGLTMPQSLADKADEIVDQ